jgi:hypothetical protein
LLLFNNFMPLLFELLGEALKNASPNMKKKKD